ncbi:ROK family protein [Flavisolibacter nicotianae]|uniref:ROK family protein n=1 Tax=Flavisolibacter nicotianae TaxID=2364882 RepID=UPI000EAF8757|nr:ROK family protein [Flavisolibacter nicotianae]
MVESLAIGVDIGGSHITAAQVDLATQRILLPSLKRAAVNTRGDADEIISAWCSVLVENCKGLCPQTVKIGIAMPGPFDYQQGVSYMREQNKFDSLYGLSVRTLLAEKLGLVPENISFLNDAACFLKGEVFGGAAKGCSRVLGLTLGTGFGSAIFDNGLVEDANLWCDPYKDGIAEDLFSTRWFVKRYTELTGRNAKDVKGILDSGCDDKFVKQVFREFGENLGEYLVGLSNRFDFDTVVIGGNIAKSFPLFAEPLQNFVRETNQAIAFKQSVLNENAALVGAASIWQDVQTGPRVLHSQELR